MDNLLHYTTLLYTSLLYFNIKREFEIALCSSRGIVYLGFLLEIILCLSLIVSLIRILMTNSREEHRFLRKLPSEIYRF